MRKKWRWFTLFLSCVYILGNYYCYDEPAALEIQMEHDFSMSKQEFGFLYSVYSLPNLFLPFLGGIIFDKMGTRLGITLYTLFVCIGQGIFAIGGRSQNMTGYEIMLAGRCIFGIGCEGMYVGQSYIIAKWFINHELPWAMGIISFVPLIGSFASGFIVPWQY